MNSIGVGADGIKFLLVGHSEISGYRRYLEVCKR